MFAIKYIEESINETNQKNLILEPLCVILRLAILQFKNKGTKLSVKNNSIQYQEPYHQGLLRMISGDCREDLHNLYICGLEELYNIYDENSTIRHTISHYISVIQINDTEKYRKETKFNPIIDSLKDIWTSDEIKSTISLLHLIKTNKNKDIYLDSLEIILNAKEKFVYEYIHKISTEY